jgi:hypothetical protein
MIFKILSCSSNIMQVSIFIAMYMYLTFCYLGFHRLCMAPRKYDLLYDSMCAFNLFVLISSWRVFVAFHKHYLLEQ